MNWRLFRWLTAAVLFTGVAGYAAFVSMRMDNLERRLRETEGRLASFEAQQRLRMQLLNTIVRPSPPFTNGAFLYDGLRPHDPGQDSRLPNGRPPRE